MRQRQNRRGKYVLFPRGSRPFSRGPKMQECKMRKDCIYGSHLRGCVKTGIEMYKYTTLCLIPALALKVYLLEMTVAQISKFHSL